MLAIYTFVWTKNVDKAVQRRDKYAKSKNGISRTYQKKSKKMKKNSLNLLWFPI